MNIPEQFFLDIMHVSFHGTLENEKKEINEFYLSPRQIKFLDQMAIKVKYPNEIKRHQREITENLGDLKANEFKNKIFNLIPLFKPVLKKEYFSHFAAYATALLKKI